MKLIVGAGTRHEPGFVHHDVQQLPDIDIVCDMWELPAKVAARSVDELHATHVAEHFPMARTRELFRLWHDLLRRGGRLYLEVPNFEWQAREILKCPSDRQIVEYAYGGQSNDWDYHYNGFTPDILVEDLLETDFKLLELRPNSTIECLAEAV